MHPEDIRAAIRKTRISKSPEKFLTQRRIAEELGVTEASVSQVINGRSRSDRIARAISEYINIPLHRLWPKWYGPETAPVAGAERARERLAA